MEINGSGPVKCSCKGVRSCLICEPLKGTHRIQVQEKESRSVYDYCVECDHAFPSSSPHPHPGSAPKPFPGVYIKPDFLTPQLEEELVREIDRVPWVDSQSGRRKQDYGPKVNFKKQKVKVGVFSGLPGFSKELIELINKEEILEDFQVVEQCNLEYMPERGSAIDPHFDDFWLWGERLVTVNLLSGTYLRMSCDGDDVTVRLPLTRRSLCVLYGPARYEWRHAVCRDDVTDRRLVINLRELTPEFLVGGESESVGTELLSIASSYNGKSLGES